MRPVEEVVKGLKESGLFFAKCGLVIEANRIHEAVQTITALQKEIKELKKDQENV